jgi:signal recognition particle GTPase
VYVLTGNNLNKDAYFKDFMDKIEDKPEVAEELGIIEFTYVRDSSKCNIPKIQASGFKSRQIIGIAPQEKENDAIFRKCWADKIIQYLNNNIRWKYENTFKFKADITLTSDEKVSSSLDECLLDEDIGDFVSSYLFDEIESIKQNDKVMKAIFRHRESLYG